MKLNHHIYGIVFLYFCGFGLQSQVRCQGGRTFMTSCGNSSTLQNAYRYGDQCPGVFRAWYGNNFPHLFWFRDSIMEYQNTSSSWSSICRWGRLVGTCYEGLLPQCEAGIGVELLTDSRFHPFNGGQYNCEVRRFDQSSSLDAFYRRTCDGNEVNEDIKQKIDDVNFDTNTTCLNTTHRIEINGCLSGLKEELRNTYNLGDQYQRLATVRRSINRVAGASINCIFSAINRSPCNQATKRVLYHVAKLQLPSFIDDSDLEIDETTTGDFSSLIRCTVFDNTNATVQGQGDHEVVLTAHSFGRQRRFIQASTGMVLTLRQWSGNYFFTLRVAQGVIRRSQGLLASGCPSRQIINRSNLFGRLAARRKRATQAECQQACNVVTDESLKEICIFDCYALQNTELAVNMTTSAEEDTKVVVELDAELISNAVTPKPTTKKPSSSASYTSLSYSVMVVNLLSLLYLRG